MSIISQGLVRIQGQFMWVVYTGCVLVAQSWPALCDPVDCSPPGSFVHGILQARTLQWVAISFSIILDADQVINYCCYTNSRDGVCAGCSAVSDSLQPFGQEPTRLLCLRDFSARILEWGNHFLLQGIFLTQRSNTHVLCFLHCRQILYL